MRRPAKTLYGQNPYQGFESLFPRHLRKHMFQTIKLGLFMLLINILRALTLNGLADRIDGWMSK
jgi:hypothetical protein